MNHSVSHQKCTFSSLVNAYVDVWEQSTLDHMAVVCGVLSVKVAFEWLDVKKSHTQPGTCTQHMRRLSSSRAIAKNSNSLFTKHRSTYFPQHSVVFSDRNTQMHVLVRDTFHITRVKGIIQTRAHNADRTQQQRGDVQLFSTLPRSYLSVFQIDAGLGSILLGYKNNKIYSI